MRPLFLIALLLTLVLPFPQATAQVPLAQLGACGRSGDCIAAKGVCGNWGAINKKYKEEYEKDVAAKRPYVDCMAPPAHNPMPDVECVKGTCNIKK